MIPVNNAALKIGYVIWVAEQNVPDRWVYNPTSMGCDFYKLETALDTFYTKTESDNRYVRSFNTAYTNRVYVTNSEGETTGIAYSQDVQNSYIVRRDSSGQIKVPQTPSASDDATSKDYVDGQIAAASIPGATFDNVPTQGSNNVVKSSGIYDAVKSKTLYLHTITSSGNAHEFRFVRTDGTPMTNFTRTFANESLITNVYVSGTLYRVEYFTGTGGLTAYYHDEGNVLRTVTITGTWTDTVTAIN